MNSPLPEEIKAARIGAGLTQLQAANLIGISRRVWQYYEFGDRKMSLNDWELFQIELELLPHTDVNQNYDSKIEIDSAPTPVQVKEARLLSKLTYEEAATAINRSGRAWRDYENGKRIMSVEVWRLFSSKLKSTKFHEQISHMRKIKEDIKEKNAKWRKFVFGDELMTQTEIAKSTGLSNGGVSYRLKNACSGDDVTALFNGCK